MVRLATSDDLDSVVRLIAEFRDWWGKFQPSSEAIVDTGADDCWLEDLFVTERARGGGHGRALVRAAFDSARERGCRRMELDVNEQNTGALGFYESLGFSREPKPPGRTLFISRLL